MYRHVNYKEALEPAKPNIPQHARDSHRAYNHNSPVRCMVEVHGSMSQVLAVSRSA